MKNIALYTSFISLLLLTTCTVTVYVYPDSVRVNAYFSTIGKDENYLWLFFAKNVQLHSSGDITMIVSKYIGETEKNLARVFDLAENRNWILFFDEADALFGKRTSTNTSNDRHANQEVAYLLQRIEDFPGMIILATNLRSNIDEAFSRRFLSVIYFPMPTKELRAQLWRKMIPEEWLGEDADELINMAAETELSGGSIANVVRRCALHLVNKTGVQLNKAMLKEALQKEKLKS